MGEYIKLEVMLFGDYLLGDYLVYFSIIKSKMLAYNILGDFDTAVDVLPFVDVKLVVYFIG